MSQVRENLTAAKALIDTPEKWGRQEYADEATGCMCAYGAVGVAAYHRDWWKAEHSPEGKALEAALPGGEWSENVARFNDDPATTHADIMALFDRAIEATL